MSTAAIARVLAALASAGKLTPENVVEEATNPKSPLHDSFIWDDSEAAHRYRLDQARALIRSVEIEVKISSGYTIRAPAFVRDPSLRRDEQGYASVIKLRSDEEAARDAIINEFSAAVAALKRARVIAIALNLGPEFEDVYERTSKLLARVKAPVAAPAE